MTTKALKTKKEIADTLSYIITKYDDREITTHLSILFQDYPAIPSIPDRELLHILQKYEAMLELDIELHTESPYDPETDDDIYD